MRGDAVDRCIAAVRANDDDAVGEAKHDADALWDAIQPKLEYGGDASLHHESCFQARLRDIEATAKREASGHMLSNAITSAAYSLGPGGAQMVLGNVLSEVLVSAEKGRPSIIRKWCTCSWREGFIAPTPDAA